MDVQFLHKIDQRLLSDNRGNLMFRAEGRAAAATLSSRPRFILVTTSR